MTEALRRGGCPKVSSVVSLRFSVELRPPVPPAWSCEVPGLIQAISADPLILLIPIISAFVGWFTNVLAVKMMFYPIEFVGLRPFLGWQGIVPANSEKLARTTTRLITERLVALDSLFAAFEPDSFAAELDHVIDDITEQVIEEVAAKRAPAMWSAMGEDTKKQIHQMLRTEVHAVTVKILADFRDNIQEILDLEETIVQAVIRDRRLTNEMFLRVGAEEFKFVERSGAYFGLAFGIVQMVVWAVFPAWWILPAFGFLVGYATNWVALKLIFEPAQPKRFGPWVLQGLFHKRQREVSEEFGSMVAGRMLNADNIVHTVTAGPGNAKVMGIIEGRVGELMDKYASHPMASMVLPESERDNVKRETVERIQAELPKEQGFLHTFAAKAVDIKNEITERMKELDPVSFENVLRPAFKQDEWKLIVAGAVLGLGAGIAQLVYLFGDAL